MVCIPVYLFACVLVSQSVCLSAYLSVFICIYSCICELFYFSGPDLYMWTYSIRCTCIEWYHSFPSMLSPFFFSSLFCSSLLSSSALISSLLLSPFYYSLLFSLTGRVLSEGRTSSNAWCSQGCEDVSTTVTLGVRSHNFFNSWFSTICSTIDWYD